MKWMYVILVLLCFNAQSQIPWASNREAAFQMVSFMQQAESFGLDTMHYQLSRLKGFLEGRENDSMQFDMHMTEAALHFFRDLAYGNARPTVSYNGLNYSPDCYDLEAALGNAFYNSTIDKLVETVQPSCAEYEAVKQKMNVLQRMVSAEGFKEEKITAGNSLLLKRFHQLGIVSADTSMKSYIKQVQQVFNLLPDGKAGPLLLKQLNVPLSKRILELKLALNTIRWLACARAAGPVIVVNIPSANLLVYDKDSLVMESRIIVGKQSTRTPTLISKANEVVLYPYWRVPKSIATKEFLPIIQRRPGYLDENGLQVLNQQGRVVNPYSIDWNALSRSNFPYVLRQSTGCDNSLGLVKLNFYNPFNVYLHDTPWKVLFAANKRYFSHGCMRVERAMDLAHLLLAGNTIAVDTLEDKGCLRNQSPITVKATVPMTVFVLYNTAWVDGAAMVRFNQDVYEKLKQN